MFLQMVHTRFDIILYTRAVNGVRAYFAMRAFETGVVDFEKYLKLPTKLTAPPYREGMSRAYWWQFLMISVIDATFAGLFVRNLSSWCVAALAGGVFFAIHAISYYGMSHAREQKEILGVGN